VLKWASQSFSKPARDRVSQSTATGGAKRKDRQSPAFAIR
jgi:hypothetical protein